MSALGRWGPFSSLKGRILALNAVALTIMVVGIFSLGQFRANLVEQRMASLLTQGQIIAGAIGESATTGPLNTGIRPAVAAQILNRLVAPTDMEARLFDLTGGVVVDTRQLQRQDVLAFTLPPPEEATGFQKVVKDVYDWLAMRLGRLDEFPPYRESSPQNARDYGEVLTAFSGYPGRAIRRLEEGGLIVSVAVPVQRYRRVVGALMLTVETSDIEELIREERLVVLEVTGIALVVATILSYLLARTVARPVTRLAEAASLVGRGRSRRVDVPQFGARKDEIGALSHALKDMTDTLYDRIDAIEAFAADVAHELKNPLTSLRSAVEVVARVKDPDQQKQLMDIIVQDVSRLDRLISEISNASRLDAELAREEFETTDIGRLVLGVVELYRSTAEGGRPQLVPVDRGGVALGEGMAYGPEGAFTCLALEDRIGQVVRNLLDNAISFSPADGTIRIAVYREREGRGDWIVVRVEDEGRGIPEEKLETIFDRFYSERPEKEVFGSHSGLGLSISKQIIEAHGGGIWAENRRNADGRIAGAALTFRIPA